MHERTENKAIYAIAGNNGSNLTPLTTAPGNYSLTTTSYRFANKGGTMGVPYTVNFEVVNTATNGSLAESHIKLHPNPAIESIIIEFELPQATSALKNTDIGTALNPSQADKQIDEQPEQATTVLEITDMKGTTILQKVYPAQSGKWMQKLSVRDNPVGVYHITVRNSGQIYSKRIIKK